MNRVCVVTGGSSGIGAATVEIVKKNYIVYNLDTTPPVSNEIFIKCDVSNFNEVEIAIANIIEKEKRIDALVISAGIHFSANIEQTSESDFDFVMGVNTKGTFLTLKHIIPIMKKQSSGSIVIVSSDQALIGKSNSFAYNTSKAAIAAMARTIAIDYATSGIRCNAVCPGTIETPLYHHAIEKYSLQHNISTKLLHESEKKEQPIGRIGQPNEVAELIHFLLESKSSFITGALIPIDGGYTAK